MSSNEHFGPHGHGPIVGPRVRYWTCCSVIMKSNFKEELEYENRYQVRRDDEREQSIRAT